MKKNFAEDKGNELLNINLNVVSHLYSNLGSVVWLSYYLRIIYVKEVSKYRIIYIKEVSNLA